MGYTSSYMPKYLPFILFGLICIGALYFLNRGEAYPITNYPPKSGPIVAFGDSLVEGYGATDGRDFVSLLEDRIGEPIINKGVSGDTTADGLLRVKSVVALKPRIVILLLGGNDALRKVPTETTFKNLEEIILSLQKEGALVVLLGVRGGLFSDTFDDSFELLAQKTGAAYVPNVLDKIFSYPDLMFDQIHPNDKGYARIADKVEPVLTPLLR